MSGSAPPEEPKGVDCFLEIEGQLHGVSDLVQKADWTNRSVWSHGRLRMEETHYLPPKAETTLVLKHEMLKGGEQRIPIILTCGLGNKKVSVPYVIVAHKGGVVNASPQPTDPAVPSVDSGGLPPE